MDNNVVIVGLSIIIGPNVIVDKTQAMLLNHKSHPSLQVMNLALAIEHDVTAWTIRIINYLSIESHCSSPTNN